MSDKAPSPAVAARDAAIHVAAGVLAGFVFLALVDAGAIAALVPLPRDGVGLRALHHLFDAAETIGIGALAAAIVGAFARFVPLPRWAAAIVATAAAVALLYPALDDAFHREASEAFEGRFMDAIFVVLFVASGAAIPAAYLVGDALSRRPRLRLAPIGAALAVLAVDHHLFPDDYFGIHVFVAWSAATLAGAGLAPFAERALRALAGGRRGRVALAAAGAFALLGLAVPPSNAVRHELFREPCAIAPWLLAASVWPAPRPHAPAPSPPSPWLLDRSGAPPVPPTSPPLLPSSPVVVLITIDATRADAVTDPANAELFPTLTEMRERGAYFTRCNSPGSQTDLSLTALFSGRYFSEMFWGQHGKGMRRFTFASDDPSPRFPQILSDHGVMTATWASVFFFKSDFGVVRGFREEHMQAKGTFPAPASRVVPPLIAWLKRPGDGPRFAYVHLMEPHAPYDRGKKKDGTPKEQYLSRIATADQYVGHVVQALEQRYEGRWLLLVSADHGEAFGEHQTFEHSKTLYDELLHVPLVAYGPGVVHRTIDQRVGLIDLGPTILDLFGVETPATFEGQSLVPLLEGRDVTLTRPLIAEGRLRRAMITPDDLEVIDDPRRKVVEVYDLAADPGETLNLYERDPARSEPALAALRAFFAVHAVTRPGYEPPFEP